ncbi:MAG: hypothetical protein ACLPN6_22195 [Streptosporangiaceae bacterium]|jgi:hypothetical protein
MTAQVLHQYVRRVQHQVRPERGDVRDLAVELRKRPGNVRGQLLHAGQEHLGLLRAESLPHGRLARRV